MSPEDLPAPQLSSVPFEVPVAGGLLRGDIRVPGESPSVPHGRTKRLIVICHGFKGFKDWGFFPYLADSLANRTGSTVVSSIRTCP